MAEPGTTTTTSTGLTPEQNAQVVRMQQKLGDDYAWKLAEKYRVQNELEAKKGQASAPLLAPPPGTATAGTRTGFSDEVKRLKDAEDAPPPESVYQPYIGYGGVTGLQPQGPIPLVQSYTPLSDVIKQEGKTAQDLSREYQENFGWDAATADAAAEEDIKKLRAPHDLAGRVVPGASNKDISELHGLEAVWEAMKPRVFLTPEQAAEKKASDDALYAERQRLGVWASGMVLKDEDVRAKNGEAPLSEAEKEDRRNMYLRLQTRSAYPAYETAAREQLSQGGKTPTDDEVKALASAQFKKYIGYVAPSLLRETAEEDRNLRTVLPAAAGKVAEDWLTTKDPASGAVSESLLGTGLRDLGVLWRPIYNPIRDALTYEVDDQGKPLDTSDFAYQAEQAMPPEAREGGLVGRMPGGGFSVLPRPFQARTVTPETASTGEYWQDVAKDVQQGAWLGSDFASMPTYQKTWDELGYPSAPLWIGFATELAMPATPLGLVSEPLSALKGVVGLKAAQRVGRGAQEGLDVAADLGKLKDEHSVLSTAAGHVADEVAEPLVTLDRISQDTAQFVSQAELAAVRRSSAARSAVEAATDAAGNVDRAALKANLEGYVGKMRAAQTAGKLSPEVSKALDTASELVDRMGPAFTPARGSAAARDIQALAAAGRDAEAATLATRLRARVAGRATPFANDILNSSYLRNLVSRAEEAGVPLNKKLAPGDFLTSTARLTEDPALVSDAVRDTVKGVVQEGLRNKLPGDLMFITPTVVATRKAWDAVEPLVTRTVRDLMAGKVTKAGYVADDGQRVADTLLSALGPGRADSGYWRGVVEALEEGRAIPHGDYLKVFDEVLGDAAVRTGQAQGLTFGGRAASRAAVPGMIRQAGRGAGDLTYAIPKGVTDAIRKVPYLRAVLPPVEAAVARTPLAVKNWVGGLKAELSAVTGQFKDELRLAQARYGRQGGFQYVVDLALREGGKTNEQAWAEAVSTFFGPTRSPAKDEVLAAAGGRRLTPEHLLDVVQQLRKTHADLKDVGLRSPIPGVNADDVVSALTAVALRAKADATVAAGYGRLLGENPQLALPVRAALQDASSQGHLAGFVDDYLRASGALPSVRAVGSAPPAVVDDLVRLAVEADGSSRSAVARQIVSNRVLGGDPFKNLGTVSLDRVRDVLRSHGLDEALAADLRTAMYESLYGPLDDAIGGQIRSWGMMTGHDVDAAYRALRPAVENLGDPALVTLFGDDVAQELAKLRGPDAQDFERALEGMRIKGGPASAYAAGLIKEAIKGSRRTTTSGLLGGFPLPNLPYHGVNFTTAPLITAMTLDVPTALKQVAEAKNAVVRKLWDYAAYAVGRKPADVVMTDALGRSWTRQAIDEAVARTNIQASQMSFEFGDQVLQDIARVAGLAPEGGVAGKLRTAWREIDPTTKNVWARVAEASDAWWRRNVFVSALREGVPEAQAADMARRSLLDYSAIPAAERDFAARYLVVYAFRRKMLTESLASILRNPDNAARVALLGVRGQQIGGTWMNSSDDPKYGTMTRLWGRVGPEFDGVPTGVFGPSNPAMESLRDVVRVLGWGLTGGDGAVAKDAILDEIGRPELQLVRDLRDGFAAEDGPMVPAQQVAALMETGTWPAFVEMFHVEPVYGSERRAGTPTYGSGVQFRFADREGANRYLEVMTTLTLVGLRRNIDDYSKWAVMGGVAPEGADMKRFGPESGASVPGRALGLEVPTQMPSLLQEREQLIRRQLMELRTLGSGK